LDGGARDFSHFQNVENGSGTQVASYVTGTMLLSHG